MPPTLLILLSIVLSGCDALAAPRKSFLLSSTDRPLVHFPLPDDSQTSTLLLSPDSATLYVGAQDAVFSLDVSRSDIITLKQKVTWKPSEAEIQSCHDKGKNVTVDCLNFVHVLQQINSSHLYVCGSFAFSPQDAFIDIQSFSLVQNDGAKGRCPFSPFERTSAITLDGELFTATTTDFRGNKPQISRFFSKDDRPDINLDTSISAVNEPEFIGSSFDSAETKLYFFFNEVGKEFQFVNELQIPRVAQVCKDDVGGQRTLQKKWTSFAKAPLLCQSPKQLPFNLLQDVFTLRPTGGDTADMLFYGVFTSQWSVGHQSAVCAFRLEDVRSVFQGRFKSPDMQNDHRNPQLKKHSYLGKCGLANASDSELTEVKRHFLTSGGVKPVGDAPLVVSDKEVYSRVTALKTKAVDGKEFTILFLLTESGFLQKVVLFDEGPRVIEEVQVSRGPQRVKSVILSPSKSMLYVGTSEGVTAVPSAQCSAYRSCPQCLLSRDPQCGWSPTGRTCTAVEGSLENLVQNLEGSNPEEGCQGQTEAPVQELYVSLNEVVTLPCVRPSSLSTLSWFSNTSKASLPQLYNQQTDGNLLFLASPVTMGTYHCEATEGGFREVLSSYEVRLRLDVGPQSLTTAVDAATEEGEGVTERNAYEVTYHRNTQSQSDRENWRSYHSELVVVSLLLVCCICVLILGSLHMLHLNRKRLKASRPVGPVDGETNKTVSDSEEDEAPREIK